jgi:CheY-like chemotaxis protein
MRVLIIDDDPEEIELFEHASSELNQDIQFLDARDCAESLEIIDVEAPAFIIIDIHLGPHSGIDCLKQLRSTPSAENLPIVMYSTSGSKHHIDACYNERANYFFIKPNSIREIGEVLQKLMNIDWKLDGQVKREAFVISA